jgi:tetratricopeptide (TPR) repeat protein
MKTRLVVFIVATMAATAVASPPERPEFQRQPDQMDGDALLAAYAASDDVDQLLARAFPTVERFDKFGQDFRNRVLRKWETRERRPIQAAFMLDVAVAALNRRYPYLFWLDFVDLGRKFLIARTDPPGADPAYDAFEIAWHKTTVALLEGRRRPDFVQDNGVAPLKNRMAPAPPAPADPAAPRRAPVLVDPWIAVARGFMEEGFAIDRPDTLETRGRAALEHYGEARRYDATRAEATLRSAWLLIRMKRADEALALLDGFDDRWTDDGVFLYWRRLFHGRALELLNRPDEAIRAFEDALRIVPTAQSPRVAMMSVEMKRNHRDDAHAIAAQVRTAFDPVVDPWWTYAHGDLRFFPDRLKALRAMSRQ